VAHFPQLAVDGLDAGKEDAGGNVTLLQARRVDAGRRLGPQAFQLSVVLLDELADMGHDQDALIGPGLEHAFDEARHDQGFAPSGRDANQGVSSLGLEVGVDTLDGSRLVVT